MKKPKQPGGGGGGGARTRGGGGGAGRGGGRGGGAGAGLLACSCSSLDARRRRGLLEGRAAVTREAARSGRAGAPESMWAPARQGAAGVAMAELQQLRVQEAADSMVKNLARENIRTMQVAGRRPIEGGAPAVRNSWPLPAAAAPYPAPVPSSPHTRVAMSLGSSRRPQTKPL